ncbi:DEAD/DEAH box helicase [Frigoribacterium sp. CFBP 13729]|uniref:DEAD/DEAH box helicase n=1 Tax=unclassified Frigoribacterium TaxID=2627005 RepID=UPI0017839C45|nr:MULTISPECIES: DEAD/DEAH box helicase [unclassified Frigoribacterium]MBD8583177.1 DEAD/DEAH box helicase [Frigoribacterium sp. CFBP 8766]MBD8611044.1 DEAD/DEAH box helicase [Frigoribacterium sp. CFBP 13729]
MSLTTDSPVVPAADATDAPAVSFASLGVPAPIVSALAKDGKENAFPIQVDTLPDTLGGRDVLGRGKTGSGKTLAFSIPMAARLGGKLAGGKRRPGRPLGLVLAPTRELATQIDAVLAPMAAAYGMNTTTIFGGVSQNRQVQALKSGVDIVIACPGRLEDLMKQGFIKLDAVEITVLDEADHMADLGFLPGVTRIMKATPNDGQRLLFSATLDNGVDKLVKQFLHNEVLHSVDEANSPVAAMTHHVFETPDLDSKNALVQKLASGKGRRILFMRTKHHAKKLAKKLTEAGIPSVDLHGNLSQPQRDRNLAAFQDGSARVLVATDVAARGVHVDDIELVIHVDPPTEHKAYLHRSGRTARAGAEGDVVTLVIPSQKRDVAQLMKKADIKPTTTAVTTSSPEVAALVGEVAAYVKPLPKSAVQQQQGGNGGGGGGRSQGANAQRKRAARQDSTGAPIARADRSGRPAAGGGRAGGAGRDGGPARSGGRDGAPRGGRDGGRSRDAAPRGGASTFYSTESGRGAVSPVRDGGARDGGARDGAARDAEARGTRQPGRRAQSDGGQSRTNAVRNDQADFAASQGERSQGGRSGGGSRRASSDGGRPGGLKVGGLVGGKPRSGGGQRGGR